MIMMKKINTAEQQMSWQAFWDLIMKLIITQKLGDRPIHNKDFSCYALQGWTCQYQLKTKHMQLKLCLCSRSSSQLLTHTPIITCWIVIINQWELVKFGDSQSEAGIVCHNCNNDDTTGVRGWVERYTYWRSQLQLSVTYFLW